MEIQRNSAGEIDGRAGDGRTAQWRDVPLTLTPVASPPAATVTVAHTDATHRPAAPTSHDHADVKVSAPGARPVSTPLVLTSPFGVRSDPFTGRPTRHDGVDLAAPVGARIHASRSGRVTFAGPCEGYGNLVIIDHGQGVETRYGHASAILVKVGDSVKAGQTIAKVGNVGRSTGPHLHFEVRRQDRPVDPWPLLAGGHSRAWWSPL